MNIVSDKKLKEYQHAESEVKLLRHTLEKIEAERKLDKERYELQEKKAVAALEDRLAKRENELQQQYNRELAIFKDKELVKTNDKLQKMMEENYSKLKEEIAKIHSEGNVTTKFIQETTKEMIQAVGLSRRESYSVVENNSPKQIGKARK